MPQFSGRVTTCPARRVCIMKWRTCGAPAPPYDRPLQLLVRRHVLGPAGIAGKRNQPSPMLDPTSFRTPTVVATHDSLGVAAVPCARFPDRELESAAHAGRSMCFSL